MRKLRILILLIILAFSFTVKAEVFFEIDCNSKEITSNSSVTCEANLSYETENITDIEISYQTNLDIKFIPVDDFTLTNSNGKVNIHTDNALYDDLMNSAIIMKFTLSSNDKAKASEIVKFYNIRINKDSSNITDDLEETFDVKVIDEKPKLDSVCTLDSITVEGVKIPDFDKDKFEYKNIKVNKRVIYIDAVRTSDKSSATELGDVIVPEGETIEHKIYVTAEDGTKNTYKLFITNTNPKKEVTPTPTPAEVKSKDNTLKTLELYHNKDKIDFKFESQKDEYKIELDKFDDDKLTIKGTLNDSKASFVKNYNPRDVKLSLGKNKVLIKIKAQNGDEKIITLNIDYKDNRDADNTLSVLRINDNDIDLTKEKYEITVANDIDKTKIEATAKSSKAKVKYEDIELKVGDNEIIIVVTAENEKTKEYKINVIRESIEKVYLENIEVVGYNIDFSKDKTTYDLIINSNTNKLDINVTPANASIEILNNDNLKDGSKVNIKVTDSDGVHEYTMNISKEDGKSMIIYYVIFGIGVLLVTLTIIYLKKKKNT